MSLFINLCQRRTKMPIIRGSSSVPFISHSVPIRLSLPELSSLSSKGKRDFRTGDPLFANQLTFCRYLSHWIANNYNYLRFYSDHSIPSLCTNAILFIFPQFITKHRLNGSNGRSKRLTLRKPDRSVGATDGPKASVRSSIDCLNQWIISTITAHINGVLITSLTWILNNFRFHSNNSFAITWITFDKWCLNMNQSIHWSLSQSPIERTINRNKNFN